MKPCLIVLVPSLRISGGIKETVKLVQELAQQRDIELVIVSMWEHSHEVETGSIRVVHLLDEPPVARRALAQLPRIAVAFRRMLSEMRSASRRRPTLLLTHYVTYALAWVAPWLPRICFNQDMEWLFVQPGVRRWLLKRGILATNRRSAVVTTNAFVTAAYRAENVEPFGVASIWADPQWLTPTLSSTRNIDVLMLLRGSPIKRLDLYRQALTHFRAHTKLRLAAITPDREIAAQLRSDELEVHVLPTDKQMQVLYNRSRIFLLLSDVEGFGLPPLEAMGSGCVPVCRDSGGVRCYMRGVFQDLLLPLDTSIESIVKLIADRLRQGSLPGAVDAQNAFATGLAESRATRSYCLRRLAELLK